ncbi:IS4 family transposase [Kouleothrix sp.]|uniref:IS4 family transposase n=1 Tax=Kouleothrix sp. TaxID=2779161 RepID=UPI003918E15A
MIAWRVMFSTMLARAVPDVSCTRVCWTRRNGRRCIVIHRTLILPGKTPGLHDAVGWIARLGGFQGRKDDGEPGVTVMWRGFQHLADLTPCTACSVVRATTNMWVKIVFPSPDRGGGRGRGRQTLHEPCFNAVVACGARKKRIQ